MLFKNRQDAARRLLAKLDAYRNRNPLVLGIPRGGVPMARLIADGLHGQRDVVLVHKLPAPYQKELAVGAVDEQGRSWVAPFAAKTGADGEYLEGEIQRQLALLRSRRKRYTPGREGVSCEGRITIVVDDGVATGATLAAALRAVRLQGPRRLIAAVGVASTQALETLSREADEVVCGYHTDDFTAVGQFFADFREVTDAEVVEALEATFAGSG